ncbi:MAG: hypothetical protein JWN93_1038 [Hyphomicrobiales bacterium]|nr:hypothetical protein [Hyphomicrobiales bacterium]
MGYCAGMQDMDAQQTPANLASLAPGRTCGTCMMCCKVLHVRDLDKPPGVWCGHATPGKGCGVYASKPQDCGDFWCGWMQDGALGPEWKPDRAKFLLASTGANTIVAVDPAFANAWRREPYESSIRRWAREGAARGRFVFVRIGRRCIALLPDGDKDLGDVGPQDDLAVSAAPGPAGAVWRVEVRRPG